MPIVSLQTTFQSSSNQLHVVVNHKISNYSQWNHIWTMNVHKMVVCYVHHGYNAVSMVTMIRKTNIFLGMWWGRCNDWSVHYHTGYLRLQITSHSDTYIYNYITIIYLNTDLLNNYIFLYCKTPNNDPLPLWYADKN